MCGGCVWARETIEDSVRKRFLFCHAEGGLESVNEVTPPPPPPFSGGGGGGGTRRHAWP